MSISALLDRSLDLQRATISADASGASVRAFTTLLSGIACSLAPASASVVADYARRDLVVTYHVYTNADLDTLITGGVGLTDRFTDGTDYYLVKAVKKSANAVVMTDVIYQIDCELRGS